MAKPRYTYYLDDDDDEDEIRYGLRRYQEDLHQTEKGFAAGVSSYE